MDNIQKLEQQADLLFQNLAGWESSTLQRIGKRINKYSKLSLADVKAINNIAVVKQDMESITKELARVTGLNISQVEQIYAELIEQQHLANQPLYDYRGKTFVPFAKNRELQAIARAYARTTGETMINLAKISAMNLGTVDKKGNFVPLQKFYTDSLDKAVMQITTGATDFHTAMRDTIQALGGSGMRVNYGSGITRRLDTAVRQSLLWGAKQASAEYNDMIGKELGCDGIEIDWHSFPRPKHEFMQGKQFVLGKARMINGIFFESADEALAALEDYGCLHFKIPIICGVSEPRYSPSELARLNEQNKRTFNINGKEMTGYEATQAMRRLETGIREQKSIRDTAKASGDTLLVRRCNERINTYKSKYTEISDITGIAKEPKRMSVPKSKNVLTNNTSGGIINTGNEVFRSKSNKSGSNRIAVSQKRFDELTIEAKKNGAKIIKCEYNDEIFKHLEKSNATASCIGDTLLFRPDATISEVLEETHHFMQNINGLNDDKSALLRTILNEIEAKEFIINNAKKYNVPRAEIEETIKHLESYKKQLKEYYKGE